jgi:hypothetical protein
MTKDQLEGVIEGSGATKSGAEWRFPEGVGVTIHVSRGGAGLTVARVESVRVDKALVVARTTRGDSYAFDTADVLAVQVEGGSASRRAGF